MQYIRIQSVVQKRKVVLFGYYHYYCIHLKPYNHRVQSNRKLLYSPIFLVSESDVLPLEEKKAFFCFIWIELSVIGLVVSALWDSQGEPLKQIETE